MEKRQTSKAKNEKQKDSLDKTIIKKSYHAKGTHMNAERTGFAVSGKSNERRFFSLNA